MESFLAWCREHMYQIYLHQGDKMVTFSNCNITTDLFKWKNYHLSSVLVLDQDEKRLSEYKTMNREMQLEYRFSNCVDAENLIKNKILHVPQSVNVFNLQPVQKNINNDMVSWMHYILKNDGYVLATCLNSEKQEIILIN